MWWARPRGMPRATTGRQDRPVSVAVHTPVSRVEPSVSNRAASGAPWAPCRWRQALLPAVRQSSAAFQTSLAPPPEVDLDAEDSADSNDSGPAVSCPRSGNAAVRDFAESKERSPVIHWPWPPLRHPLHVCGRPDARLPGAVREPRPETHDPGLRASRRPSRCGGDPLPVAAQEPPRRHPSSRRPHRGFGVLGQPAGRCRETCRSSQHGG
jgi:hypothetical protein